MYAPPNKAKWNHVIAFKPVFIDWYKEGYEAGKAGISLHDNPYKENLSKYYWYKGWANFREYIEPETAV